MKLPKPATVAELISTVNTFNTLFDLHLKAGAKLAPATLPLLDSMRENALAASTALGPLLKVEIKTVLKNEDRGSKIDDSGGATPSSILHPPSSAAPSTAVPATAT